MSDFGFAPGQIQRRSLKFYHSTRHFEASSTLGDVDIDFFTTVSGLGGQYQNFTLPSPLQNKIWILGLQFDYGLTFTGATADAQRAVARSFENFSFLAWGIETTELGRVPVTDLLPTAMYRDVTTLSFHQKQTEYFQLTDPAEIPPAGNFFIKLIPQKSLTLSTPGLEYLPNSDKTLASNLGFYMRLKMYVTQQNPIA